MGKIFEITFYREIVGDNGHCRNMPIEVVEVARAGSREAAVADAIRRFENSRDLACWNSLATHCCVAERRA